MLKYLKLVNLFLLVILTLLSACSSDLQTIYTAPPKKYEKLGKVSATADGSLGIISTGYYFIPMGLNSRVNRAYERALEQAPGATALIDVTYNESWYWWVIGTARKVTINGEAIKEIR